MTGDAQEAPLERLRKISDTGDFANWNRWRELSKSYAQKLVTGPSGGVFG